ncbi:hypothetical protein [Chitinophaga deserti]|uniref:hypothetical protein n=1 Tax=Chitinophaga deserti TaxID=2164099 RepID=UPI000D6C3439|nr:hypothetical protein [Chitinophaga deserti]
MKNITAVRSLPFWLIIMSLFACKKTESLPAEPPGVQVVARPIGEAAGELLTQTVGVEGGVLSSADGNIEIVIPAGALDSDTEIGIQPLHNTAISGIGNSYRLTPHGKSFKKPVTVRFNYAKYLSRLSNSDGIEIATQNEKGQWICPGGTLNDKNGKVISVQTNHFSDWAFIASMELSPVVKTIGLGETVTLRGLRYIHPTQGDDWVVPLTAPNAGTGEPLLIESKYMVKWTLQGPGKLEGKGAEARYVAPDKVSGNTTTATVTLELNVKGKQVLLISTIYLITDGINISINNQPWHTYAGMATFVPETGKFTIGSLRITEDIPQIVFLIPRKPGQKTDGIYAWSMPGEEETSVSFEYAEPGLQKMYVSVYDDGNETRDSGGFISVEEIEENGKKYLTGVFAIDQAGIIKTATGEQVGVTGIKGTLKVQRNW